MIGVSSKNIPQVLTQGILSNGDIDYAIYAVKSDVNYKYIIDGTMVLTNVPVNFVGAGSGQNDIVEIVIERGFISGRVWREAVADPIVLFSEAYDLALSTPLYPLIICRGDSLDRLSDIKITSDPYVDPPTTNNFFRTEEETDLANPQPPTPTTIPTLNKIDLGSTTLARFLGFKHRQNPLGDPIRARHFKFIGDSTFDMTDTADAFIVLLDNIQLKSYDDFDNDGYGKGGRKNILGIVPQSDSDNVVIYEPNNLIFVDIANSNPVNIRNIKARIVKNDYSPVNTSGLSTLSIIIKNDKE